jgi:hypothetical protein
MYVLIDAEEHEISMKRITSIAVEIMTFSLSVSDVTFLLLCDELHIIVLRRREYPIFYSRYRI